MPEPRTVRSLVNELIDLAIAGTSGETRACVERLAGRIREGFVDTEGRDPEGPAADLAASFAALRAAGGDRWDGVGGDRWDEVTPSAAGRS